MATRKIHFFTGKGGVGKSTLAAAFAQHLCKSAASASPTPVRELASELTLKILLAELTERSFYSHFFASNLSHTELHSFSFDLEQWSPEACLREYALHLLKIESLYKLFFQNPVSKSLIQVAPGLQELAILGKATSSPRKHGPPTLHDEIVLDAFASGHFLNLMRSPKAMSEIISFGPMAEQSRSIDKWIRNPDFTFIHIVTTAEDYAVTETLELAESIKSEFKISPKIYLNKTSGLILETGSETKDTILYDLVEREDLARQQIQAAGFNFLETPLDTSENNFEMIHNLSLKFAGAKHV